MAGYIEYELETDLEAMLAAAFDRISAALPGWVPREGHLEVVVLEECLRYLVETNQVTVNVAAAIFKRFGQDLIELGPILGAAATGLATITVQDDNGYIIPAGFLMGYQRTGDDTWGFRTTAEYVVAVGDLTVEGVQVQAIDLGDDRNGLPVGTPLVAIDLLNFVTSIELTSATAGGVDPETDTEYLNRLREELKLLAPRPILAGDFAVMARRSEGVFRATAIDNYDPGPPEAFDQERMVTVIPVAENGQPVTGPQAAALAADLEARREQNFVVHVIDPTYTDVDVVFEAKAIPGADPAAVEAAAEAAVAAYLDPATWAGGDQDPPEWRLLTHARRHEIGAVLNAVPGLDYVTVLTLGKNGGAQADADVALDGAAPLPSKVQAGGSTVVGTVTAP